MAASRARPKPSIDPEALELELARVRQRVLAEGAVKLSALKPKALRDALVPRLVGEGLEANASWLRRPLAAQLHDALGHGVMLSRKALAALVRGASAAELQRTLKDAEGRGALRRVLRGKTETFTGPDAVLVGERDVGELRRALGALDKMLAKVTKTKGLSLLRSDVEEALGEAWQVLKRRATVVAEPAPTVPPAADVTLDVLLSAVDASRDERTGMSFVPKVVARLLPQMPLAVVQEVLLTAARHERIELRPEGGLSRLTPEELEACPPGPGGTRLSWVRRVDEGAR